VILGINGIRLIGDRSGVARCIEALLRQFETLDHPFTEIRVYSPAALPDDVQLPSMARSIVLHSRLPYSLWEQTILPKAHGRAGLLLCPSYVAPMFARSPTFLIHHGSYEGYPKAFSWWVLNKARFIYALSAWRATCLSTVSAYSREDIVRYYRLPKSRINVIPEGVDTSIFRPCSDEELLTRWRKKTFGSDVPYIAYVGKPTERRNLSALIRAYAKLKFEKKIDHSLLIAGTALPGGSPFREVIRELGLQSEVTALEYIDHEEMPILYNAADVFIYPSSYEGFGMPVLEAMACGTPFITLDNTAFPEFAGGIGLLLADAEVETLADGLWSLLENRELQKHMAEQGPLRAADYEWKLVAKKYLGLMVPIAEQWEQQRKS
jgi:glycosyltransferase involved in cell wall biosynthesis